MNIGLKKMSGFTFVTSILMVLLGIVLLLFMSSELLTILEKYLILFIYLSLLYTVFIEVKRIEPKEFFEGELARRKRLEKRDGK